MSAARTKPHQRALMATDSEWARIGEAAAAAGMEKSRYVIHRTLAPESLAPEVMRRAIRQSLVLAVLEERRLRATGAEGEGDGGCAAGGAGGRRGGGGRGPPPARGATRRPRRTPRPTPPPRPSREAAAPRAPRARGSGGWL
ncbi:MAG: hypothetical protein OXC08_18785, partial [Thiotrichales bacterium]|nr:hypothetical protein [Thiotrichales bacterium]